MAKSNRIPKHSESGGKGIAPKPEYATWTRMKNRCVNPNNKDYKHYGERGICVFKGWSVSYKMFLQDVGRRPTPKHTLGRIDNDGNYEPGNVRWETYMQQARNRSSNRFVAAFGETKTIAEWCRDRGISDSTLTGRLDRGWPAEEALSKPVQRPNYQEDRRQVGPYVVS